jgi:hypothetical protein
MPRKMVRDLDAVHLICDAPYTAVTLIVTADDQTAVVGQLPPERVLDLIARLQAALLTAETAADDLRREGSVDSARIARMMSR